MKQKPNLKTMTILFRTHQAIESLVKKDVRNYQLTVNEFAALEVLYHKGKMPVQSMCQAVLIPNSSMTYVLDKLEEKGYINRIQDADDKRTFYVDLSEKGHIKADEIFPNHYKVMENVFEILTNEEKQTLNALLKKLGYHAIDMEDL
ncbi:MarR family winged helix-turn-helix transcriptional regulator [Acholeplasma granularum]|uniref:MarR family winged helix-turn-helix transcriptional regulator n=1 Tax=Acholeplasma granularum TaxID=264635 RepID=UPI00046F6169|nr:MarR family transcriptional regulator [Acholeplasma granularum]